MSTRRWPAWIRWVVWVALPSIVLVAVASWVPDESLPLTRSAAQVIAVLVPFGIAYVFARWRKPKDVNRALGELRAHLEPLTAPVPDDVGTGLDDPAYRVTPYWGRGAIHTELDALLNPAQPQVVLLVGPAWTGKTRLLTEWALTLPDDVVVGWLRPDSLPSALAQAQRLNIRLVLLYAGSPENAAHAMSAIAAVTPPPLLILETRNPGALEDAAESTSPAADRLMRSATRVTVDSPGRPSDMEFRYGQMVHAYEAASHLPAQLHTTLKPHSSWHGAPIGLLSALALMRARADSPQASTTPMASFERFWGGPQPAVARRRPRPVLRAAALERDSARDGARGAVDDTRRGRCGRVGPCALGTQAVAGTPT